MWAEPAELQLPCSRIFKDALSNLAEANFLDPSAEKTSTFFFKTKGMWAEPAELQLPCCTKFA